MGMKSLEYATGLSYPQFSSFILSTEAEIPSSSTTNIFADIISPQIE
jgi:hypothetical protein